MLHISNFTGYCNRSRPCLQACPWWGWVGGAKQCWLEEVQDPAHHSQCPTLQPDWASWAVLSCRACAQHSSQDGAVLLQFLSNRTHLWQEMGPGQLPLSMTCVALPLPDSTAQSSHRTIIPDCSWQGCPVVSTSCKGVNDQEELICAVAEVCMVWCPWGAVLFNATPLKAQGSWRYGGLSAIFSS